MRRPEFIAKQGRCPTGLLGLLIARIMATETAAENDRALTLLELQAEDSVLEIGFGHGRTIAQAAATARSGFVAGVDASAQMLQMATRHNRRLITGGRVELKLGDSTRLPYADGRFDKVYAVHTLYFWRRPADDFREIHRVMRRGGRFALGFRPKDDERAADFPASIYTFYSGEEVEALLRETGFAPLQMMAERFPSGKVLFAVAHRDN